MRSSKLFLLFTEWPLRLRYLYTHQFRVVDNVVYTIQLILLSINCFPAKNPPGRVQVTGSFCLFLWFLWLHKILFTFYLYVLCFNLSGFSITCSRLFFIILHYFFPYCIVLSQYWYSLRLSKLSVGIQAEYVSENRFLSFCETLMLFAIQDRYIMPNFIMQIYVFATKFCISQRMLVNLSRYI